jgi:hypothetical protein
VPSASARQTTKGVSHDGARAATAEESSTIAKSSETTDGDHAEGHTDTARASGQHHIAATTQADEDATLAIEPTQAVEDDSGADEGDDNGDANAADRDRIAWGAEPTQAISDNEDNNSDDARGGDAPHDQRTLPTDATQAVDDGDGNECGETLAIEPTQAVENDEPIARASDDNDGKTLPIEPTQAVEDDVDNDGRTVPIEPTQAIADNDGRTLSIEPTQAVSDTATEGKTVPLEPTQAIDDDHDEPLAARPHRLPGRVPAVQRKRSGSPVLVGREAAAPGSGGWRLAPTPSTVSPPSGRRQTGSTRNRRGDGQLSAPPFSTSDMQADEMETDDETDVEAGAEEEDQIASAASVSPSKVVAPESGSPSKSGKGLSTLLRAQLAEARAKPAPTAPAAPTIPAAPTTQVPDAKSVHFAEEVETRTITPQTTLQSVPSVGSDATGTTGATEEKQTPVAQEAGGAKAPSLAAAAVQAAEAKGLGHQSPRKAVPLKGRPTLSRDPSEVILPAAPVAGSDQKRRQVRMCFSLFISFSIGFPPSRQKHLFHPNSLTRRFHLPGSFQPFPGSSQSKQKRRQRVEMTMMPSLKAHQRRSRKLKHLQADKRRRNRRTMMILI